MKNNSRCSRFQFFTAVFLFSITTSANAALVDRGGGLIYDTDLNITWLADANYAKTSGYITDGYLSSQDSARTWAANLSYYDSVRNVTYDDWRLPTTLQYDPSCSVQETNSAGSFSYGYNCTGSEMGHLFYTELGGLAGQSIATTHNTNYNLFQNVQSVGSVYYWTASEFDGSAWMFGHGVGVTNLVSQTQPYNNFYAWAVRDGDVAAVPIPAAFWLFGSGLVGLFSLIRWRPAGS